LMLLAGAFQALGDSPADNLRARASAGLQSGDAKTRVESLTPLAEEVYRLSSVTPDRSKFLLLAHDLVGPLKPELLKATRDENVGVRAMSAVLLAYVAPDPEVVAALLPLAREPAHDIHGPALGSLVLVGRDAPDARKLVLDLLDPTKPEQFGDAAYVAREWRMKEAVPALIQGLAACDLGTKQVAARTLEAIGSDAAGATRALEQELEQLKLATGAVSAALEQIRKASQPGDAKSPAAATPSAFRDEAEEGTPAARTR
jgi:hypothetical protein